MNEEPKRDQAAVQTAVQTEDRHQPSAKPWMQPPCEWDGCNHHEGMVEPGPVDPVAWLIGARLMWVFLEQQEASPYTLSRIMGSMVGILGKASKPEPREEILASSSGLKNKAKDQEGDSARLTHVVAHMYDEAVRVMDSAEGLDATLTTGKPKRDALVVSLGPSELLEMERTGPHMTLRWYHRVYFHDSQGVWDSGGRRVIPICASIPIDRLRAVIASLYALLEQAESRVKADGT